MLGTYITFSNGNLRTQTITERTNWIDLILDEIQLKKKNKQWTEKYHSRKYADLYKQRKMSGKKWNKNIYGTWWQSSNILKLLPKITKTIFVKRHKDMVLRSSVNQIHDEYKSNNMGANHKTLTNKDKVETLKAYK